jgi:hypothetical protein
LAPKFWGEKYQDLLDDVVQHEGKKLPFSR